MKVKYKLEDRKESAKLEKEFYKVLAYGDFDNNSKIFLIANDNLEIIEPDESVLEIIETDLAGYIQKNELNDGRDFHIDIRLLKHSSNIDNYRQLKLNEIWTRSKLSNFFIENNYNIPENYKNSVLNLTYKLNLIEGFLMFAKFYINTKNKSDYSDDIYFYIANKFDQIIEERFQDDMKVEDLERNDYKILLYDFISSYLYEQNKKEEKSKKLCTKLFKLIDSIFINSIGKIYLIHTFYDEVFAIEYEDKYFCLSKTLVS